MGHGINLPLHTLLHLSALQVVDEAGSSSGMVTRDCRVIVRDMSGKHCYDLKSLFPGPVQKSASGEKSSSTKCGCLFDFELRIKVIVIPIEK